MNNENNYGDSFQTPENEENKGVTDLNDPLHGEEMPRFDRAKERATFSMVGLGIAVFASVGILVSNLLALLVKAINPDLYLSREFSYFLFPFCLYVIALPLLLLVYSTEKPSPPEKKKFGFGKWLLFLLVCFGCMYIGSIIGTVVTFIIEAVIGYSTTTGLEELLAGVDLRIVAVYTVIIAPIGEEFVFRKLMIDRLRKYGCFPSILLSALAFGLMHGNFKQFFYAFAVGSIFGYVYYHSGKIYLTMAMHAVINFVGSVFTLKLSQKLTELGNLAAEGIGSDNFEILVQFGIVILIMLAFLAFMLATIVCAIVLPIVFRKRIILSKGEIVIPKGKFLSTVFLNVGVIIMLVIFAGRFVLSYLPI